MENLGSEGLTPIMYKGVVYKTKKKFIEAYNRINFISYDL